MASHSWDNEIKPRYIYLLAFDRQRVYVGQSVAPHKRIKAHRRPSGGWLEPFQPLIVHRIDGTELDAVDLEYAWRWCANLSGWTPIDSRGDAFDMVAFRDSSRQVGARLPWPFTT